MSDGIAANQTSQSPLHLRITDGNLTATLGTFTFEAQTVPLTPNATNYVFLDLSQEPPVLTVNTTGFPASAVWTIATAVTNDSQITQLTDSRPQFNKAFSGGGSPGGATGDVQFNKGDGTFTNAAGIGSGSVAAMDSGGSLTLTGNGTFQFTAGSDVTFNLGRNFSLIGSGTVNFDTTNGGPSSASRISLLSAESIVLTALQDAAGQVQLNTNHINLPHLQIFANNAAAISGGLVVGDLYRTGADPDVVCIVH